MTGQADTRADRGRRGYHAGLAAEARVARDYVQRGYVIAHERWRGKAGEIDLVLRDPAGGLVFVEVKQGRNHDTAAARLGPRQMRRLAAAAEEFAAGEPTGLLTEMRFDVALVDGSGVPRVIENAFGAA